MEARFSSRSLSYSVLLHAIFVAMLLSWGALESRYAAKPKMEPLIIELEIPSMNKQIVQSTAGEKTDKADPKAFLGKDNRIVDRETIAKFQNTTVETPMSKPQAQPQKEREAKATHAQPAPFKVTNLANLGVPLSPVQKEKPKDRPDYVDYTAGFGGAVPQDYIKGMKETEQTALNTREFAYYGYFQRVRGQLDHAWDAILREKLTNMYRSGRSLASESEHTTRTVVFLDPKGEVVRVQVLEESGVLDLDDAAIKAFNQAGPFPNPPKDMVESSGLVRIRWDFVLKT
jgi:protein TonB